MKALPIILSAVAGFALALTLQPLTAGPATKPAASQPKPFPWASDKLNEPCGKTMLEWKCLEARVDAKPVLGVVQKLTFTPDAEKITAEIAYAGTIRFEGGMPIHGGHQPIDDAIMKARNAAAAMGVKHECLTVKVYMEGRHVATCTPPVGTVSGKTVYHPPKR